MSYSTIAILYNPNSTGPSEAMARTLQTDLKKKVPQQVVELIATERVGHAEELAYSIAKKSPHPLIVSSSGDGGYNEVVNGALKAQKEGFAVTTGLLPAGNANDHHRNIHNKDIVSAIVDKHVQHIDVLKIVSRSSGKKITRYAHSYIGFGVTPHVGKELNTTRITIFNQAWLVARALFTVKSVPLKVGFKVRHYESIIFSNVDQMSKYLKISQPSSVTDGKFEVTIFRRRNKLQLVLVLIKSSLVGVKQDSRVAKYSLRTVQETLVQVDGEIVTLDKGAKATIGIEKQALRCIV